MLRRAVLGTSLAAAVWVYTYRVWNVVEYIDRSGTRFHASERVEAATLVGVPSTVVVLVIGAGLSLRLLPERRRITERFFALFGKPDEPQ